MERSVNVPRKAEEKDLSEKIYIKLSVLTQLYPASDELRKCLSNDMFVKSNQLAFFHVMHFLFRLLDPGEFKKRFFWPITDKRAEASFRSSTIEYLKFLNEKHNLHWNNIKSYLVVMPGGMKFMAFLLDLLAFVVKELKKQAEKNADENEKESLLKRDPLKTMAIYRKQRETLKEFFEQYFEAADKHMKSNLSKIKVIENELSKIAQSFNISTDELLDVNFLKAFKEDNEKLLQKVLVKQHEELLELEKPLKKTKQNIQDFEASKRKKGFNEDAVKETLQNLGVMERSSSRFSYTKKITLNSLVDGFNILHPDLKEYLESIKQIPTLTPEMESELNNLYVYTQEIEEKLKDYNEKLKDLEMNEMSSPNVLTSETCASNKFMSKFICTPPIKIDMARFGRETVVRLPLLDEPSISRQAACFNNFLGLQNSAYKSKKVDRSFDPNLSLNSTLQNSKIIDGIGVLRTISKNRTKARTANTGDQKNSDVGLKWKQKQSLFQNDSQLSDLNSSKDLQKTPTSSRSMTLIHSPFTPFNSNLERTRVECISPFKADISFNESPCALSTTSRPTGRKSALQKVQDDNHLQNLSTSPSGRLEPLVNQDGLHLPKIAINDVTFPNTLDFEENSSTDETENCLNSSVVICDAEALLLIDESSPETLENKSEINLNDSNDLMSDKNPNSENLSESFLENNENLSFNLAKMKIDLDKSRERRMSSPLPPANRSNDENNSNALNTSDFEDDLLNTSDTVLKDIIF